MPEKIWLGALVDDTRLGRRGWVCALKLDDNRNTKGWRVQFLDSEDVGDYDHISVSDLAIVTGITEAPNPWVRLEPPPDMIDGCPPHNWATNAPVPASGSPGSLSSPVGIACTKCGQPSSTVMSFGPVGSAGDDQSPTIRKVKVRIENSGR